MFSVRLIPLLVTLGHLTSTFEDSPISDNAMCLTVTTISDAKAPLKFVPLCPNNRTERCCHCITVCTTIYFRHLPGKGYSINTRIP